MRFMRPVFAPDPRLFGRRRPYILTLSIAPARPLREELRFFATAFIGGFLFMAILVA